MPGWDVTLYTRADCADSPRVREWLQRHGIPFDERAMDDDPDAVEELRQTGMFVTPLLLVDGERVIGYRPARLASLFDVGD